MHLNFLNLEIPIPHFGGSTGGWLRAGQTEEKYAIVWSSLKKQFFEIPTGGTAIMREGENLIYFARKEQCLALSTQLKVLKILDSKIYRLFPNGEIQYLHPKDGVFPEKVNEGRIAVNTKNYSIGKNINPIKIKFTNKNVFDN